MRYPTMIVSTFCVLATTATLASPDNKGPDRPLDCNGRSLAQAVASAKDKDLSIKFTGVCAGPIVITKDGLKLEGVGNAVIDGGGEDAILVDGASGVSLSTFEVRNAANGIVASNGAHLTMREVNVHNNSGTGITLQTASSADLTDVTTAQNGFVGLEAHAGSTVVAHGALNATSNAVFGINVNGSSLTLERAVVTSTGNVVGIQISTNANAFIADPTSEINANSNFATGLTIVSGAHLVSFGGVINATGNAGVGVSVNSRAGLDLDAGSILTASNNGDGLLVQTNSTMSVFNTPQFSGAPGFSTIETKGNVRTGVRVLADARLTLVNQARVTSMQNGTTGFVADNGAGVTLVNSTITGNTVKDIQLTFGVRADLRTLIFGTVTCDSTVLLRGTSGITCPQ